MARIICISDLHLGSNDTQGIYGNPINENFTQSIGTKKGEILCEALAELNPKADIIIFCGDYVSGRDSAEKTEESYNEFLRLLELINSKSTDIFSDISIPVRNRIIISPGNHDIERVESGDPLRIFKEKFSGYITPFYKDTLNPIAKYAPVYIFDEFKLIIACISTVNNSSTINDDIVELRNVTEKEENISAELREKLNKYYEKNVICDIPTLTSDFCRNFVKHNKAIENDGEYDDYTKILVTHHPILSGVEHGKTIKSFNYTVGGFEFLEQALIYDYSLFIHGHMHEFTCFKFDDYIFSEAMNKAGIQVGVPELKVNDTQNGVVIVDTDNTNNKSQIFLMKLDDTSLEFKQLAHVDYSHNNTYSYISPVSQVNQAHILVDSEIVKLVQEQKVIKNGDINHVEAASYDCSLGYHYKRFPICGEDKLLNLVPENGKPAEIKIPPNETVLIYTYEKFEIPDDMVLHASPIASWMRRGLRTQISHFVDPGFVGEFCFPVTNESKDEVVISSREPIISIEFFKLQSKAEKNWKTRHPDKALLREERMDK